MAVGMLQESPEKSPVHTHAPFASHRPPFCVRARVCRWVTKMRTETDRYASKQRETLRVSTARERFACRLRPQQAAGTREIEWIRHMY